jgi:hypothetical protein
MPAPESKPPNPLIDLLLTIILPSLVLDKLSEPARLGPMWALVVASLIPLGFGVYCHITRSGLNFFSVLGLVAVLISGGFGLMKLNAFWFAMKECSIPIFLGLAFPLSHRWGKPLIEGILLAPHVINKNAIMNKLDTEEKRQGFGGILMSASWKMGGVMLLSAVLNFALAMYLLGDKEPGGELFVKAIGKLNWAGFIVIGLPLMIAMFFVLTSFLKGVQKLTGLDRDDIMNPGSTVRRQVGGAS